MPMHFSRGEERRERGEERERREGEEREGVGEKIEKGEWRGDY
jgi:hypothetical protein